MSGFNDMIENREQTNTMVATLDRCEHSNFWQGLGGRRFLMAVFELHTRSKRGIHIFCSSLRWIPPPHL